MHLSLDLFRPSSTFDQFLGNDGIIDITRVSVERANEAKLLLGLWLRLDHRQWSPRRRRRRLKGEWVE